MPINLSSRWRRVALTVFALLLSVLFILSLQPRYQPQYFRSGPTFKHSSDAKSERLWHPIDDLRTFALEDQSRLLAKKQDTLEGAAAAYIERRGRRPPPGFDKWYAYAQSHDAIIVEDFFDRIYHDLEPFWGMSPEDIKKMASKWHFRVSVRDGAVSVRTDAEDRPWMVLWPDLVSQIASDLPDLDMPINIMDESRVVVPFETLSMYMNKAAKTKKVVPTAQLIRSFAQTAIKDEATVKDIDWKFVSDAQYWQLAVRGCDPDSPARKAYVSTQDYRAPPPLDLSWPKESHSGYVQNWTYVKSICDLPAIQELHGTFIEPLSMSTTDLLIPMFGGSKLSVNNAILLPPAMYWSDNQLYSGGSGHGGSWKRKIDQVIWRGVASGGRHKADTWARYQRHRFVGMVNGTTVTRARQLGIRPPMFALPEEQPYDLASVREGDLGGWLSKIADAAFVDMLCFPSTDPPRCNYSDPWYKVENSKPMSEQYAYKYLPDIDGNSFSGRYRGFLASSSLPIKATIYDEWHDSRLMPWVHFVPMHNTFVDLYGILEYFIGTKTKPGHDDVAEAIATQGMEWAAKVLRKDDMVIYVFRLLLEYGRICDDQRERLGWTSEE